MVSQQPGYMVSPDGCVGILLVDDECLTGEVRGIGVEELLLSQLDHFWETHPEALLCTKTYDEDGVLLERTSLAARFLKFFLVDMNGDDKDSDTLHCFDGSSQAKGEDRDGFNHYYNALLLVSL